ncbi:phage head spike fiber domain-containing protein [Halomonas caseinilytica]|uniref:phage head spike fiber domain-containing protein n=1 Tax=Halomonas caseinilytica TaxID=438744 RepID=UPI0007E57020|nr:hypothetical protein [Halomonas caseinilytica]SEN16893.1 hypothetical protein SAMN04487952_11111 [Halomonas caseinilytica]
MAELDPALQDEISNLQTRHTALVDAVRNYSGGSIAQATNDLLAAQAQTESTIDEREAALLGLIQRNTTKPVPSLLSDFATRTYMTGVRRLEHGVGVHDMWNVSRSSVRWVWGPNGKLVEVASDQPAYAYDPETGDPLGISVEPTRTNDLSDSSGMSDFGAQRHTRTLTTDIECPTGDNIFAIERTSTGALYGIIQQGREYQAGEKVTFSYVIHPNGHDQEFNGVIRIWSGPNRILDSDVYVGIDENAQPLPGGWYRVHATVVADKAGFSGASYNISSNMDVGDIFYISSPQLEKGDVTSYIPTSGSTVTRETDSIYKPLRDEYNPNGFSVYAEARQKSDTGSVFFLHKGGLTNSIRVGLPTNNDRAMYVTVDGSVKTFANLSDFPGYAAGDPAKIVLSVDPKNNRVRLTINGETVERTADQFPTVEEERLGNVSANNNRMNGTIKDYQMYPIVLTQSEAEAMTL